MANGLMEFAGRRIAAYLSRPVKGFTPLATANPGAFVRALRRGDVVLVEGNTRVASAIKYLTQSTWSHSAIYVGPIAGRQEADGEPHVMIEADMDDGVISVPASKYAAFHTRICRPVGLSEADAAIVCEYAVSRIGNVYDLKNVVDLLRYFLPAPPVPTRWRRRMIAFGAGSPTQAICSTLIAQAFQSIGYPILPSQDSIATAAAAAGDREAGAERAGEVMRIRHHSLFTPRDFDISPYFAVVKQTIEIGFDFKKIEWVEPAPQDLSGENGHKSSSNMDG